MLQQTIEKAILDYGYIAGEHTKPLARMIVKAITAQILAGYDPDGGPSSPAVGAKIIPFPPAIGGCISVPRPAPPERSVWGRCKFSPTSHEHSQLCENFIPDTDIENSNLKYAV